MRFREELLFITVTKSQRYMNIVFTMQRQNEGNIAEASFVFQKIVLCVNEVMPAL